MSHENCEMPVCYSDVKIQSTGYICHHCKTTINANDAACVDDLQTPPRWYHAICKVSEECDQLRSKLDYLGKSMRLGIGNATPETWIAIRTYNGMPICEAIGKAMEQWPEGKIG